MKSTFLVHGFNVSDGGEDTICRIKPSLRAEDAGGHILTHQYRRLGLIGVLMNNDRIAVNLVHRVDSMLSRGFSVNAAGHSNGCAIIVKAARKGAKFESVVLINPALNTSIEFPSSMKRILIVHTRFDRAVRMARFFDALPLVGLLIPDIWGAMGAVGHKGLDPRVTNLNLSDTVANHSDIFTDTNLALHGPTIARWMHE